MEEVAFVVNGTRYQVTRTDVSQRMRGSQPEPVRNHTVEVEGVVYPVKQVFEAVTGIDRLDFTSATARRQLAKLGFEPTRERS